MDRNQEILNAAIMEVVDNQIRDLDPPETKQTYERLLSEGISEQEAKSYIAGVVASEIFEILKNGKSFDRARYIKALSELPKLPGEDEG